MRVAMILGVCLFLVCGCGKRGALIYPDMLLPAAPAAVTARQSGAAVKLSFNLPAKDRAGRGLKGLSGIKVFRREAETGQGPACNACTADFALLKQLYLDVPDSAVQRFGDLMVVMDSSVREGVDYTYRVVPVTRDSVDGAASEQITVGLVKPPPPPKLKASPAATEILFSFSGAQPVVGELAGFNLYRSEKGKPFSYQPYNNKLITAGTFVDERLRRHVVYSYVARSVVRMPNGALVESIPSLVVNAQLQDE